MLPFVVALQVTGAPPAAPPPAYPPYVQPYPYPQPYPYAPPYPYAQPSPYPPYPYPPPSPYPPAYPRPPESPPPTPPKPDPPVDWFLRAAIGLGPPSFSDESAVLKLEGYGGVKLWVMADGAYMVHPNIGLGAWGALSSWSSSPPDAPDFDEDAYFIGAEAPIRFGGRSIAFMAAARIGYATGQVQIEGDAPFQSALAWGAEIGVSSLRYHLSGALGFLSAAVGPSGEIGRDHDYGGFYVMIGGTIDG